MGTALTRALRAFGTCGLAVALIALALAARGASRDRGNAVLVASSSGGLFSIVGHVSGLYPGKRTQIRVTLRNPNRFAIRVSSITVTVGNASSSCRARNVVVKNFDGSLKVEGHSARRLRLPIRMRASAPDACRAAKFPLGYRGKAMKA